MPTHTALTHSHSLSLSLSLPLSLTLTHTLTHTHTTHTHEQSHRYIALPRQHQPTKKVFSNYIYIYSANMHFSKQLLHLEQPQLFFNSKPVFCYLVYTSSHDIPGPYEASNILPLLSRTTGLSRHCQALSQPASHSIVSVLTNSQPYSQYSRSQSVYHNTLSVLPNSQSLVTLSVLSQTSRLS